MIRIEQKKRGWPGTVQNLLINIDNAGSVLKLAERFYLHKRKLLIFQLAQALFALRTVSELRSGGKKRGARLIDTAFQPGGFIDPPAQD